MKFLGIGTRINHPEFGVGVVLNVYATYYSVVFMEHGQKRVPLDAEMEIIEFVEADNDLVSMFDVEQSLTKIMQKWMGATEVVPIGDKWKGGTMILKPGRDDVSSKEIPMETFFHKIVMVRDRLRVMEQKVNASELDDEVKVDIQQYISRCYGSMTTFNILFKEKEHHFSGK